MSKRSRPPPQTDAAANAAGKTAASRGGILARRHVLRVRGDDHAARVISRQIIIGDSVAGEGLKGGFPLDCLHSVAAGCQLIDEGETDFITNHGPSFWMECLSRSPRWHKTYGLWDGAHPDGCFAVFNNLLLYYGKRTVAFWYELQSIRTRPDGDNCGPSGLEPKSLEPGRGFGLQVELGGAAAEQHE